MSIVKVWLPFLYSSITMKTNIERFFKRKNFEPSWKLIAYKILNQIYGIAKGLNELKLQLNGLTTRPPIPNF